MFSQSPTRTERPAVVALVLLPAVLLLLCGLLTFHRRGDDVTLYYHYSQLILSGEVPYRDFRLEYPPLALLTFLVPRFFTLGRPMSESVYSSLYLCENVFYCLSMAAVLAKVAQRHRTEFTAPPLLLMFSGGVVLTYQIMPWRYDLFPALLTLLSLQAVVEGKHERGGVWIGLGVAAKLYPVVLLPVFGLRYLANQQRRQCGVYFTAAIGTVFLTMIPFLVVAPHDLFSFLRYHQQRGLQIESIPAGVILLFNKITDTPSQIVHNFGAFHLVSPLAPPVLKCLLPLFLALYCGTLAVYFLRLMRETSAEGLSVRTVAFWSVAALLTFLVSNKVFSPQYVIWLLPFIPLLRRRYAAFSIGILALTCFVYPIAYNRLLALNVFAILALNLRNVLTVALLLWMLFSAQGVSRRVGSSGEQGAA